MDFLRAGAFQMEVGKLGCNGKQLFDGINHFFIQSFSLYLIKLMTLIIKELIVKSTIIDRSLKRNKEISPEEKEEIINACLKKLKRELRYKNR